MAIDTTQELLNIGDYEDYDLNSYINDAFAKADRNFTRIFAAIQELATSLDPSNTSWRVFTGGGISYRAGSDTDGVFKIQQALTALGFNGVESTDEGATGDYITLWRQKLGQ
jgi:hypothetical protein